MGRGINDHELGAIGARRSDHLLEPARLGRDHERRLLAHPDVMPGFRARLRIQVDQYRGHVLQFGRDGEIDGEGGFAGAAFLRDHCNDFHVGISTCTHIYMLTISHLNM